ncbi:similar to Saccharomyces cerevisiae YBR108W AIM3 Protein interacting with Rvs167p [Maudiozyma saulgeensis]|uniref:Similar to Saccharomyces cerevisiae YBR108W AIM3 Protein interacting with Rvs167p n=1 Tax=Maudiozyma saulgeensis TaxID=1789683 RepID=A0A1X7QXG1_9SACH|nr:similar to Saccharomyces cerevisiae YBR108W AIM3 Protein interacting with Rvs167p [Kazachstania saulgeensis]
MGFDADSFKKGVVSVSKKGFSGTKKVAKAGYSAGKGSYNKHKGKDHSENDHRKEEEFEREHNLASKHSSPTYGPETDTSHHGAPTAQSQSKFQPTTPAYGQTQYQPGVTPTAPIANGYQPGVTPKAPIAYGYQPGVTPVPSQSSPYQPGVAISTPQAAPYQPGVSAYQPGVTPAVPQVTPYQPGVTPAAPQVTPYQPGVSLYQQAVPPGRTPNSTAINTPPPQSLQITPVDITSLPPPPIHHGRNAMVVNEPAEDSIPEEKKTIDENESNETTRPNTNITSDTQPSERNSTVSDTSSNEQGITQELQSNFERNIPSNDRMSSHSEQNEIEQKLSTTSSPIRSHGSRVSMKDRLNHSSRRDDDNNECNEHTDRKKDNYKDTLNFNKHDSYDEPRSRRRDDYDEPRSRRRDDYDEPRSRRRDDYDKPRSRRRDDYDEPRSRRRDDYNEPRSRRRDDYDEPRSRRRDDYDEPRSRRRDDYDEPRSKKDYRENITKLERRDEEDSCHSRNRYDNDTIDNDNDSYRTESRGNTFNEGGLNNRRMQSPSKGSSHEPIDFPGVTSNNEDNMERYIDEEEDAPPLPSRNRAASAAMRHPPAVARSRATSESPKPIPSPRKVLSATAMSQSSSGATSSRPQSVSQTRGPPPVVPRSRRNTVRSDDNSVEANQTSNTISVNRDNSEDKNVTRNGSPTTELANELANVTLKNSKSQSDQVSVATKKPLPPQIPKKKESLKGKPPIVPKKKIGLSYTSNHISNEPVKEASNNIIRDNNVDDDEENLSPLERYKRNLAKNSD